MRRRKGAAPFPKWTFFNECVKDVEPPQAEVGEDLGKRSITEESKEQVAR